MNVLLGFLHALLSVMTKCYPLKFFSHCPWNDETRISLMVETKKRFREMLVTLHSSALSLFTNEERDTVFEGFDGFR